MTMTKVDGFHGFDAAPRPAILSRMVNGVGSVVMLAVRAVQCGQMMRVLTELSDRQLNDIGLERADIPAYANWLVHGEGENRWEGAAGQATFVPRKARH